jgi:hypothetical protein
MAAPRDLHVAQLRFRKNITLKYDCWGDSMLNRSVSSVLAAAMAFALAGTVQAAEMKAKKEPSAAQAAARARMSKCSLEWKEAKTSGKAAKDMKWPKFWSECNKRLKEGMKA